MIFFFCRPSPQAKEYFLACAIPPEDVSPAVDINIHEYWSVEMVVYPSQHQLHLKLRKTNYVHVINCYQGAYGVQS